MLHRPERVRLGAFGLLVVFVFCCAWQAEVSVEGSLIPQNVSTPFWEPLPFATLPIVLQTSAVFYQDSSVMGKVYTIGGQPDAIGGANLVQTNAVYVMDVATEQWQLVNTSGDTFTGRVFHTAVVLTNNSGVSYVAVYGGFKNWVFSGTTYGVSIQNFAMLNLETFAWENRGAPTFDTVVSTFGYNDTTCCTGCAACPSSRAEGAAVVFENDPATMYLYGGLHVNLVDGNVPLDDLWKYNIVEDKWTQLNTTNGINPSRASSAVVALNNSVNQILLFGGYYLQGGTTVVLTNDLWILEEVSEDQWTWIQVFPIELDSFLPPARADPCYVLVGTGLFMWGGDVSAYDSLGGPMWFLDTSDNNYHTWNWTTVLVPAGQFEPPGISGSAVVFIPTQGTMTVIGGVINATGAAIPNVYRFHALGLLPPPSRNISGLSNGYDFRQSQANSYSFNSSNPNFALSSSSSPQQCQTIFATFIELDSLGSTVAEFRIADLSDFGVAYEEQDFITGAKVTVFTRHALPGNFTTVTTTDATTIRFEFFQYDSPQTLNGVPGYQDYPILFPLGAGIIKFSVKVNNWPFRTNTNTLTLMVTLSFVEQISSSSSDTSYGSVHDFSSSDLQVQLQLLSFSFNDNNTQPVTTTVDITTPTSVILNFTFLAFEETLYYDPTFGVILTGNNNGGDGGSDNTAIYMGVFVSVGVVAILVLLVIAISILVTIFIRVRWRRKRADSATAVEFE